MIPRDSGRFVESRIAAADPPPDFTTGALIDVAEAFQAAVGHFVLERLPVEIADAEADRGKPMSEREKQLIVEELIEGFTRTCFGNGDDRLAHKRRLDAARGRVRLP